MASITMDEEMMDVSPRTPVAGSSEVDVEGLRRMQISVVGDPVVETPRSSGVRTSRVRRKLFEKAKKTQYPWSTEEMKSLISFVMLYSDGQSWMTHKDCRFWGEAGSFIQSRVYTPYKRSGNWHRVDIM